MTFGKVIAVAITGGLLALASMAAVHAADKKKPAAASEGGRRGRRRLNSSSDAGLSSAALVKPTLRHQAIDV